VDDLRTGKATTAAGATRTREAAGAAKGVLQKLKIGIVGGTGYTGVELLRILARHPHAELRAITSRKDAWMPVAQMFP
jgi:NADH dehydrogenase FAD-containing subunit